MTARRCTRAMKLRIVVAAVLGAALGLAPTPVSAKGPDALTLTGPGLEDPVRIDRGAGLGAQQVSVLVEAANLYTAFGYPAAKALSPIAPPGERGPRYVATYSMSGGDTVRQDLYPFAEGGPLAYTPPDQSMYGKAAYGSGWQRVDDHMDSLLVSFGVPAPVGAELEWVTYRDHDTRLSISSPPSWRPATTTVAPLLVDPVIPLALGTYAFPTEGCGAVLGPALEALGPKDAFIAVYVFRGGATWEAAIPERPTAFGPDLPWTEGLGKCADDVRGTIRSLTFPDGGLRLDVMVAIGSDASTRRQNQVYRILDTLTVERPQPPS